MAEKKMTQKEALAKYEKSAADKKMDTANAKKMGMSMAKYEKSSVDKKADLAGAKKLMQKANAKPMAKQVQKPSVKKK